MFSINCLEITVPEGLWDKPEFQKNNQSIYKNLLSKKDYEVFNSKNSTHETFRKRFFFNDFFEKNPYGDLKINSTRFQQDDFFGNNKINIQAIVGENGAGKSSLMDLMYMAINNLSFMFERGKNRPGAEPLYYIPGLYVNLYFSFTNTPTNIDQFCLQCKEDNVWFYCQNVSKKNYFFNLYQHVDNIECFDDDEIAKLVKNFFYTIVSNYSLQSFIPSCYKKNVLYFDNSIQEMSKKKIETSWINSIFHKNDSYIRSIVLNPFRGDGRINLENEIELSKDRLTALLIWYKQEKNPPHQNIQTPFYPYEYNSLSFSYKKNFIREKIRNHCESKALQDIFDSTIKNDSDIEVFINNMLNNADSFLSLFLKEFFIETSSFTLIHKLACAYIIAKILSIVKKYPSYLKYKEFFYFVSTPQSNLDLAGQPQNLIIELFDALKKDSSHITKKLRRAVNFLRTTIGEKYDITSKEYFDNLHQWYIKDYGYLYAMHTDDKHSIWLRGLPPFNLAIANNGNVPPFLYPAKIDESLPPSFFSYELYVNNIETNQTKIPYRNLSSGEIQMLQTLSIHAYHMENIFSISEMNVPRPKYFAVNLVFDEVEICFHPEYQRTFVKKLLDLLQSLSYNSYFINVFIITHSPFILSDIPTPRILYLEKGSQNSEKKISTFAGNIGEMFYDSFFLKTTIGNFAESKIKELIKFKHQKNSEIKNSNDAEKILRLIGDPVIKGLIEEIEKKDGEL